MSGVKIEREGKYGYLILDIHFLISDNSREHLSQKFIARDSDS
jgi:hypothetical protein